MSFNVTFDATVNAQQQAAVQSVANFFNAHFTDPISVDIAVSFANLGPNGLGASSYSLNTQTFASITTALTNDSTSADDASAVASLPGSDPVTGTHSWTLTPAEEMALGIIRTTARPLMEASALAILRPSTLTARMASPRVPSTSLALWPTSSPKLWDGS